MGRPYVAHERPTTCAKKYPYLKSKNVNRRLTAQQSVGSVLTDGGAPQNKKENASVCAIYSTAAVYILYFIIQQPIICRYILIENLRKGPVQGAIRDRCSCCELKYYKWPQGLGAIFFPSGCLLV